MVPNRNDSSQDGVERYRWYADYTRVLAHAVPSVEVLMEGGDTLPGFSTWARITRSVTIPRLANSRHHVLITGESGTGKERIFDSVVSVLNEKQEQRVCTLNCAAMSRELLISEIFGHKKGSFTGADKDHEGIFAKDEYDVFFLDEIGSSGRAFQAALLRFIERGTYRKVGGDIEEKRKRPFRIFASTNESKKLRPDLKARFPRQVHVPPLSKRRIDVVPILHSWLRSKEEGRNLQWFFPLPTIVNILLSPWKENVRELLNAAELSYEDWQLRWGDEPKSEVPLIYEPNPENAPYMAEHRKFLSFCESFADGVEAMDPYWTIPLNTSSGDFPFALLLASYTGVSGPGLHIADFVRMVLSMMAPSRGKALSLEEMRAPDLLDVLEKNMLWFPLRKQFGKEWERTYMQGMNLDVPAGKEIDLTEFTEEEVNRDYWKQLVKRHGPSPRKLMGAAKVSEATAQRRLKKYYKSDDSQNR